MHELKEKIEGLHYREHKHIVIQGIITGVRYIDHSSFVGGVMHKKYSQPANTKNTANVRTSESSTKYRDNMANSQASEQDYFYNFHETSQTFNQVLDSEEEVISFGREHCTLSSTLKNNAPDSNLLSNSEETEEEYFTADEDHPEMDDVAKPNLLDNSWESSKWPKIKGHLKEFLSFDQLLPESCPQRFEYAKKEAIMSQHNLHPSRCDSYLLDSISSVEKLTTAWTHCYYTLTIIDLNQEIAMDVIFLPLGIDTCCNNSARNTNFISILSGDCASEAPTLNGSEIEGKHFLCILDVYHHGNDQTEVILSRAYKTE
ncbi:RPA-related protein RADX-like [Amblyraja radiata]|uniref:RPA-related protein RADX-like n=1 Tax=Amblyraja radiata TaxID=386614 RepID=UPI0014026687|nr:RPA-related protein RADX-like [Amblyraja radiata]